MLLFRIRGQYAKRSLMWVALSKICSRPNYCVALILRSISLSPIQWGLQVYERGVKAIPLSVELWTAYLDTALDIYHSSEDYESTVRR